MQKIRFLPLLCVLLMLFTAPTLLAQQEPDTPYPAETMLSVRMMPPGERSLRNFLYPKLMAQEASIQLPAGTSYNLLVQTLDNMRNDYPELFHIDSYRVHYQRNQPDVAQSRATFVPPKRHQPCANSCWKQHSRGWTKIPTRWRCTNGLY